MSSSIEQTAHQDRDDEALARIARGAFVLDVRTPDEFAAGHFPHATNVPVQSLGERLNEVPNGPIVVYCKSGGRSAAAKQLLASRGYADVHDAGGMHRLG